MYWNSAGLVKERWVKSGAKPRREAVLPGQEDDEIDKLFLLTANNTIRKEIEYRIDGIELHDELRSFLHDHWSKLLRKIFRRNGTEGAAWTHALEIIDDMVSYIITSQSTSRKRELKDMHESLERRFRNGLKIIALPETVSQVFFTRLASYCQDDPGSIGNMDPPVLFGEELLVDNKKSNK